MRILIIVTSSTKKKKTLSSTYNEQEIGLARALISHGNICEIAYYAGNVEDNFILESYGINIEIHFLKGIDFLKTSVFKDYSSLYEKFDILMPISYDHYETYHIAMRYPTKTVIYNGTYFSPFNKRYNFKCSIIDKIFVPRYKKSSIKFVTKNNLSAQFLKSKGIKDITPIGVGFDKFQMQDTLLLESDLSNKIKEQKKQGKRILLYIGRIEPRRNTLFLLDVFAKVKSSNNAILVVIGNGKDKYKNKCKKIIDTADLDKSIIYKDKMEQKYLPLIYSMADIFLLPTSYEIFGMVLLEAMYFGVPVITTLNGGSDILIKDKKNGYIIPELNINQWEKKIIEVLNEDTKRLSKEAHNQICNNFTWDSLAAKFIEGFQEMIDSNT